MAFGENQLAELEPVTQSRGAAAIKRSIAVFEQGLIISYAVGVRGETPVTVTVADNLPANWDVGKLGFHPDHEPDSGDAGRSTIRFTTDVMPDEVQLVKVGVRPAPDKRPEELESDQSFSTPQIENADPIEPEQGRSESTLIDGPSDGESAIEDPSSLSSNGGQSNPQSPTVPDSGTPHTTNASDGSQDDQGILPSNDPIADVGSPTADSAGSGAEPEDAESVSDLFGGFSGEDTIGNSRSAPAETVTTGGTTNDQPVDDGQTATVPPTEETTESPLKDEPMVGDPPQSPTLETPSGEAQGDSGGVLPQLLDELAELSDDHEERFADHLSEIIEPQSDRLNESTTVRVQQLESRVEEFAAYTDALGELLDRDEPAALLDDVQTELDSLRQEVSALQQDVKEVHDRQNTIEVRIESIISDLEHVIGTQKTSK